MAERTQSQTSGHCLLTRPKVQLRLSVDITAHIHIVVGLDYCKKVWFYSVKEAKSLILRTMEYIPTCSSKEKSGIFFFIQGLQLAVHLL